MRRVPIVCAAIVAVPALVFAHSGATGVVKERMELMDSIASQMKLVGEMIKGQRAFAADSAVAAANMIAKHAAEMPEKFPEGSLDHPSEALPVIWEDWDDFLRLTEELETAANLLAQTAQSATDSGELRSAFATLGKTCSACHEGFRKAN